MNELIQTIIDNGLALVGIAVIYYDMRLERQHEREENTAREEKLYSQLNQSNDREQQYQKIIQEYNYKIIPTLEEIKDTIKENLGGK